MKVLLMLSFAACSLYAAGQDIALENTRSKTGGYLFVGVPGPGVFRLRYTLNNQAKTQWNVWDLTGRQIQRNNSVNRKAGTYTETINISGYAKGVYLLELIVNGGRQAFKVIYQ